MTRSAPDITSPRKLTALTQAVNVAALIAFQASPGAAEYPEAALSIVAFLAVQTFLPACRLNAQATLCPLNVAQGLFWIQLVLVTVLIGYWGIYPSTLPELPSHGALTTAMFVQIVAYLAFSFATQWISAERSDPKFSSKQFPQASSGWHVPESSTGVAIEQAPRPSQSLRGVPPKRRHDEWSSILILPYALLGIAGFFLVYQDVRGFLEFFGNPDSHRLALEKEPTLGGALGTFLRYFLGFAIVLTWSLWIGRQDCLRNRTRCLWGSAAAAMLLLAANLSYNRGSMLGPELAFAAAFSRHVIRIPFRGVVLAGGLAIAGALAFGAYRASNVSSNPAFGLNDLMLNESTVTFVQIYASGPQMGGFLIDHLDRESKFYFGSTLIPSLLYPVPVIGKSFRSSSGVYLFNDWIYGDPTVLDQVIPLGAELYMNFHYAGVAVGYALLGGLISWFQSKFLSAPTAVESYAWMTIALWTIFPGSLPVASQLYVYAFWPIYIYLALKVFVFAQPARRSIRERKVAGMNSGKVEMA